MTARRIELGLFCKTRPYHRCHCHLLLRLATRFLALGPEFLSFLTMQAFGIGLVGAGFGNRFLLVLRSGSGGLRQDSSDADREKQKHRARQ
jgi:hypothetical protein